MMSPMEVDGLLAEADYAEKTGFNGGMVLLTPAFTRRLMDEMTKFDILFSAIEQEAVERYCDAIRKSETLDSYEICLVIGNIRGFADHVRKAVGQG